MNNFLDQLEPDKLLNTFYLLDATPSADGLYIYLMVVFGLLIVVAAILFFIKFEKYYRKLQRKLIILFLTVGLVGFILIFLRYEQIPYLSSRLLILLLLLLFAVWLLLIIYYYFRILPVEIKEILKKENFEKYLPRRPASPPASPNRGESLGG